MADRDTGVGPPAGGFDLDDLGEPGSGDTASSGSVRGRLRGRIGRLFSLRAFLLQVVLVAGGVVVLGGLLPFGTVGDVLGIALAAFAGGLATRERRYLETGLAGAAVGGLWALLGNLVIALLGVGVPVVTVGAGGGALGALLGHYFGRDLRDGLTREL
jgi:hypothetical protein